MLQLIIIPLTLVNIKINPGFNYKRGETYWTTVGTLLSIPVESSFVDVISL
jgi:hypothetical protein